MKRFFDRLITYIETVQSPEAVRLHVVAGIRLLLQVINYGLLEWIAKQSPEPARQPRKDVLRSMRKPSDGDLVDQLDQLLVSAEQCGWTGICLLTNGEIDENAPARRISKEQGDSILALLRAMVTLRNNGAEGHGLVGGFDVVAEINALTLAVSALARAIPRITHDGCVLIGCPDAERNSEFLKVIDGAPCLVRDIKSIGNNLVRLRLQHYDQGFQFVELYCEAMDPFDSLEGQGLPALVEWENEWRPMCFIAKKVTDSFEGRVREREKLVEWLNDVEQRSCLVYGDGGVGKTTFVIDAIHRYLDEEIKVDWKAKLVTFYTAKRWKWGVNGVEQIRAGSPHLLDLLVHLHTVVLGRLPQGDFYRKSVKEASMTLQQLMSVEMKISRSEHLIVVDNAETLIESEAERELLGDELKEISRRVGRILITSRRREILGAEPIEIKAFEVLEAIGFVRRRGWGKLKIKSVRDASDQQLLELIKEVECRPIVLEALLRILTDPAYATLAKARNRVMGMLRKDLGEFLFADAWQRLSPSLRKTLLLLTRLGDVHNGTAIRICAEITGVSLGAVEKSLEETSGIASVISVDGTIEVAFSKNFLAYADGKLSRAAQGQDAVSDEEISLARSKQTEFIKLSRSFTGDRIASAFRTPLARAAHEARRVGDLEGAKKLFEQAIMADSENAFLYDRFAFFLFHDLREYVSALQRAHRAVELAPAEGEVWYTRGMIEARLGRMKDAENSLRRAQEFGISGDRCAIQRAWAYLKSKPRQIELARSELSFLDQRLKAGSPDQRVNVEFHRLRARLDFLLSQRDTSDSMGRR